MGTWVRPSPHKINVTYSHSGVSKAVVGEASAQISVICV